MFSSRRPAQLSSPAWLGLSPTTRKWLLLFFIALAIAAGVRWLTFNFMRARLNDAGWFQSGSYLVFDKRARELLEGRSPVFWIDDPSRTDVTQYPPAFPLWVAAIYSVSHDHSAYAVQRVQWILDLVLSLLLTTGIAVTAYGWRAALATSFLVALSPLLALYGVTPSADAPTTWFVLCGIWFLLLAAKRNSIWWALGAGLMLGVACWWRVNPLFLAVWLAIALLVCARAAWRKRLSMSAAVALAATLIIAPIVVRNYVVFPDFTPLGGTVGANLWEGLGETELGRQNGFLFGDDKMIERERVRMGLPADFPIEAMWPDGIRRERERTRESLAFIKQHPVWYAGVMIKRMGGMLKVAGEPQPYYGTAGINVTSAKTLAPGRQGGVLAFFVNVLGMVQSVARYLLLPLAAFGVWLGARRNWMMTSLLLAAIVYYLVPGTAAHTEIRYVLPLHCLLPIFAGLSLSRLAEIITRRRPAVQIA